MSVCMVGQQAPRSHGTTRSTQAETTKTPLLSAADAFNVEFDRVAAGTEAEGKR